MAGRHAIRRDDVANNEGAAGGRAVTGTIADGGAVVDRDAVSSGSGVARPDGVAPDSTSSTFPATSDSSASPKRLRHPRFSQLRNLQNPQSEQPSQSQRSLSTRGQHPQRSQKGQRSRFSLLNFAPVRAFLRVAEVVVVVAAVGIIVSTFFISVLEIRGTSMEPTLHEGDLVVTNHSSKFATGDMMAFYYNNRVLLKRVIGFPGDWVDIKPDGTVYVNDVKLHEDYVQGLSLGETDIVFPYQVPENRYFVLGDHRNVSIDSRSEAVGTVSEEQIVGRVLLRVWPLTALGPVG
ncbi:MAG: signal peptidase I [Actinomycetaceae bacterium]|nr:signal peptidase I [Arcanobacterium sp.]MDD7686936.1 signal peptidase I [Actinomycetaceae bacterium]MDY5273525.1 signal peptidase I [Arcanobacterium sp.]